MRILDFLASAGIITACVLGSSALAEEGADESFDGLVAVEKPQADQAFVRPGVDFSVYERFMILEPAVAFARDWQRDMSRGPGGVRIRDADMERIQAGMAEIFLEVFTQELEQAGYAVVEEEGDDVMLLRPAIIDLRVNAPDVPSTARSRSYVTSAGSARLYIEFYDSVSGQILARAVDYKRARDWGQFQWATSVSNRQEARKLVRRWATMLVQRLDEIRGAGN